MQGHINTYRYIHSTNATCIWREPHLCTETRTYIHMIYTRNILAMPINTKHTCRYRYGYNKQAQREKERWHILFHTHAHTHWFFSEQCEGVLHTQCVALPWAWILCRQQGHSPGLRSTVRNGRKCDPDTSPLSILWFIFHRVLSSWFSLGISSRITRCLWFLCLFSPPSPFIWTNSLFLFCPSGHGHFWSLHTGYL